MTKYPIINGAIFERDKGGRPARAGEKTALIAEAATNVGVGATDAAKTIHRAYYGAAAQAEGNQFRSQLKYLSNLIRQQRSGILGID